MSPLTWIGVGILGGVGALLRFFLDGVVALRVGRDFPFGTLIVNICGALVLGVLAGIALSGDALVLAGTATIGSFTTFSTWMLETHRLLEEGEIRNAGRNVAVSLALGLGAAALGRVIGSHI